jgi:hypothetical protein
MTISVGRLAAWLAGAAVLVVLAFLSWSALRTGDSATPFQTRASQICREQIAAIKAAPDLGTALAASRDMRTQLSTLTPPDNQRALFSQYLAALKGAEDAVIANNASAAQSADFVAQRDARELGFDACTTRAG